MTTIQEIFRHMSYYQDWLENYKRFPGNRASDPDNFLALNNPNNFITYAFSWDTALEGKHKWVKVDRDWHSRVKGFNLIIEQPWFKDYFFSLDRPFIEIVTTVPVEDWITEGFNWALSEQGTATWDERDIYWKSRV